MRNYLDTTTYFRTFVLGFNSFYFMKKFRTNGAIGGLLDEYERAIANLKELIGTISAAELVRTADSNTDDPDCRSVQTVLAHVVRSGYTYSLYVGNTQGEALAFREAVYLDTAEEYQAALDAMFEFTEAVFSRYPTIGIEVHDNEKKILVRWGQSYDIEQLMEHAIVHILRHRRQIERFMAM
ncbi:MAG: hypothetical protein RI894_255 [Bacteroidota bacterium]